MFFENNQGNANDINVNTTITTWFSDIASLTIGCWNEKLSLRFLPPLGKDANGYMKYDKQQRISTAISHVNIATLLKRYNKKLKDKVEQNEDPGDKGLSTGVSIKAKDGSLSVLLIVCKKDEKGEPNLYLTLARKVSEKGTDPSNIISYKFNKTAIIDNYDPLEGGGEEGLANGEFDVFLEILEKHTDMMSMIAHGQRYMNAMGAKFDRSRSNGNSNSGQITDDFMNIPESMDSGMGLPFN